MTMHKILTDIGSPLHCSNSTGHAGWLPCRLDYNVRIWQLFSYKVPRYLELVHIRTVVSLVFIYCDCLCVWADMYHDVPVMVKEQLWKSAFFFFLSHGLFVALLAKYPRLGGLGTSSQFFCLCLHLALRVLALQIRSATYMSSDLNQVVRLLWWALLSAELSPQPSHCFLDILLIWIQHGYMQHESCLV